MYHIYRYLISSTDFTILLFTLRRLGLGGRIRIADYRLDYLSYFLLGEEEREDRNYK